MYISYIIVLDNSDFRNIDDGVCEMAKTNFLKVGFYAATGKMLGKLPVKGTASVALRAAEEGIVLLKNSGLLPLKERKVALFGAGPEADTRSAPTP